jgi:hypothetical protein
MFLFETPEAERKLPPATTSEPLTARVLML